MYTIFFLILKAQKMWICMSQILPVIWGSQIWKFELILFIDCFWAKLLTGVHVSIDNKYIDSCKDELYIIDKSLKGRVSF